MPLLRTRHGHKNVAEFLALFRLELCLDRAVVHSRFSSHGPLQIDECGCHCTSPIIETLACRPMVRRMSTGLRQYALANVYGITLSAHDRTPAAISAACPPRRRPQQSASDPGMQSQSESHRHGDAVAVG